MIIRYTFLSFLGNLFFAKPRKSSLFYTSCLVFCNLPFNLMFYYYMISSWYGINTLSNQLWGLLSILLQWRPLLGPLTKAVSLCLEVELLIGAFVFGTLQMAINWTVLTLGARFISFPFLSTETSDPYSNKRTYLNYFDAWYVGLQPCLE